MGDYGGQLSDRGERVALARADGVLVDEVTYSDGWGRWTDGGGSSLELVDARADNGLAMNWAGSDESTKAGWTTVDYTGSVVNGSGAKNEIRVFHLGSGEFLLDDVSVSTAGGATHYSYDFEAGLGTWQRWGTHVRSELQNSGGYNNGKCLRVRATGRGDTGNASGWNEPFWNRVADVMTTEPASGTKATIRAKVRWQAGWPIVCLALRGYWLESLDDDGHPRGPRLARTGERPPQGQHRAGHRRRHAQPRHARGQHPRHGHLPRGRPRRRRLRPAQVPPRPGVHALRRHDEGRRHRRRPPGGRRRLRGHDPGAGRGRAGGLHGCRPRTPPRRRPPRPTRPRRSPAGRRSNAACASAMRRAPAPSARTRSGSRHANVNRWNTISGGYSRYSNEPIDLTFVVGNYRVIYPAAGRYHGLWRDFTTP